MIYESYNMILTVFRQINIRISGFNMSHYERLARNPMTYDFGFDNGESEELIILGWINYLEHSFDLVMIMEHFDESLILLKV